MKIFKRLMCYLGLHDHKLSVFNSTIGITIFIKECRICKHKEISSMENINEL